MRMGYVIAAVAMLTATLLAGSAAAAPTTPPPFRQATTLDDQTGMAVTIYNVSLGLVKDRRTVRLPVGRGELRFMDVAAQIIPASVHISSLGGREELRVLEQNYEYDLLNSQKLLDKYVGKEVKLYQKNPYTEREDVVSATLLANNDGPIYRIGNGVTFGYPGRVILPGVPESLIAKPTLVWLLDNQATAPREVEATYLTNGITWRADYVATLNDRDTRADLTGWVTIDNRSGATYRDAVVKLVAGDVHRVVEEQPIRDRMMYKAMPAAAPPPFKEEGLFEYHLYTLQRPSTIKENQTKQINLLSADAVPVKKELLLKGANYYYTAGSGQEETKVKVGVFIEMENRQEHRLGMPLPKGTVRVYKQDSDGSLQFVGEDAIDHTARDEKVRIKLGDAFDVVATRKQTDWKKLAADTYEAAFEIVIRNHKAEEVTVKVVEPVPGDWQMLSSSHDYKKGAAFAAEFLVPVKKEGEEKLAYRVRMRY